MQLKTIRDLDLSGKRVLMRVDFNLPIKKGKVADTTRIEEVLPTIKYLLEQNVRLILLSHLGRPDGKFVEELRLAPVAAELEKLLGHKVKQATDCIGESAKAVTASLQPGEVVLLENTRFYPEEEENDPKFSEALASLGDIFVQEAFGAVHRAHASTAGIAKFLPTVAGFLVEKEVRELGQVFEQPAKPLVLIIGGAKIDTKIGVLRRFSEIADTILVGGGLANTFLAAEGFEVGASLCEKEKFVLAREILAEAKAKGCSFVLPSDVVCADAKAEFSDSTPAHNLSSEKLSADLKILDIGVETQKRFSEIISKAGTIVWNGPVGLFEYKPFAGGTRTVAQACASTSAQTLLGGGDTIEAIKLFGIPFSKFTHISTGGGAMLEFLEGKKLPGIEVIEKE
jgi:phosphoglycerate kinase